MTYSYYRASSITTLEREDRVGEGWGRVGIQIEQCRIGEMNGGESADRAGTWIGSVRRLRV